MEHLTAKIESTLSALPVPLALKLPDGRELARPGATVRLAFSEWRGLAKLAAKQIGAVGEDFVEGRLEIAGNMRDLMRTVVGLLPGNPIETDTGWWGRMMRRAKSRGAHTLARDARQVEFHYDVSDDFYALWLDPRRVYSCAYFRSADATLEQAQAAKLDHICKKLMLRPGERFLDIGCGWGGLILWAAEHYGVDATGITLSKHQHAYVQQLIEQKGLAGRVRVQLCDYREHTPEKPYDKLASVGMCEHVGSANMGTYFATMRRLLAPGGLAMNHSITAGYREQQQLGAGMGDFIEKYIFPGGELLHVTRVLEELADAGLEMVDTENLRPHYARTLWHWSDALEAQLEQARRVLQRNAGRERRAERILRAYRLYLAGSAMSFEQGWIALHQVLATRPDGDASHGTLRGAQSVYPFTRDYIYADRAGAT